MVKIGKSWKYNYPCYSVGRITKLYRDNDRFYAEVNNDKTYMTKHIGNYGGYKVGDPAYVAVGAYGTLLQNPAWIEYDKPAHKDEIANSYRFTKFNKYKGKNNPTRFGKDIFND